MPTLPWTVPNPPAANTRAYVMASRFTVRSGVLRFFLKSFTAWRQVRRAPGALGASLIAQPLKRTFFTLSAWQDRDALYTYAATEPHHSIMKQLRPTMKASTFTFWEVAVDQLPITWDEAKRRLAEQAQVDAGDASGSIR